MLVGVLVEVVGVVSNVEKEVGKLVGSMPRFRVVLLNLCDTLEVFCRPPSGGPEFTSIGQNIRLQRGCCNSCQLQRDWQVGPQGLVGLCALLCLIRILLAIGRAFWHAVHGASLSSFGLVATAATADDSDESSLHPAHINVSPHLDTGPH